MSEHLPPIRDDLLPKFWGFNIPQKLKCFIWMASNNKINTWDNLHKWGWVGPNRCCLCKMEEETVEHIFVGCSFVKEVIHSLGRLFGVHLQWYASSLSENLSTWISKGVMLLYLPFFFIWNLWKCRNSSIFEDKEPVISRLCHIIMSNIASHHVPQANRNKVKHIGDPPQKKIPMGFFDGVATYSLGGEFSLYKIRLRA